MAPGRAYGRTARASRFARRKWLGFPRGALRSERGQRNRTTSGRTSQLLLLSENIGSISGLSTMAFLEPQFENDVFVSYSQGDPTRTGDSPLKRWTESLIDKLRADIQSVDTEFDRLHFFIDAQLDPTAPLTETLREKVKRSGILMIVMSPRYLASKWCKDELGWFRDQIRERSRDQGRVFVVRALATDETRWPDFLRDEGGNSLIGFSFHDPVSNMPYGWRDIGEAEYVRKLWTLQTALTKRMRELRQRQDDRPAPATVQPADTPSTYARPTAFFEPPPAPSPAPQAGAANGKKRIYVHATGHDPARHEVQRLLSQLDIIPLSAAFNAGNTLTDWKLEARARFETAKRCDALALVRADTNEGFIGDLLEIGVDERERIQSARGRLLPCAVLDQSGAPLPIDVSPFGIRRFDLGRGDWQADFSSWLEDVRRPAAGAS